MQATFQGSGPRDIIRRCHVLLSETVNLIVTIVISRVGQHLRGMIERLTFAKQRIPMAIATNIPRSLGALHDLIACMRKLSPNQGDGRIDSDRGYEYLVV